MTALCYGSLTVTRSLLTAIRDSKSISADRQSNGRPTDSLPQQSVIYEKNMSEYTIPRKQFFFLFCMKYVSRTYPALGHNLK